MQKILVLGGVTYDDLVYLEQFPEPKAQTLFSKGYHSTVGGTGAGKALNLQQLEHDVTLHAMIGDDQQGRKVREIFRNTGLHFESDLDPNGTERHINLMDEAGDRISIYANHATFEPLLPPDRLEALVTNCDVLVLNIINYCRRAIPIAQAKGKPLWVDIHDYDGEADYHRDFVEAADYLFMSSDQLPDYRNFMQRQLDDGKRLVVCTHGKEGATALSSEGWLTMPAVSTDAVDTNGAGDSFFSGFFHGYLADQPITTCLQYGALTARRCVMTRELASPNLSRDQLLADWQQFYGV